MLFHNRIFELHELDRIYDLSRKTRQFVYVLGRRRVGKTELLREFARRRTIFYFFVGRDTEAEYLRHFSEAVSLDPRYGQYTKFETLDQTIDFIFSVLLVEKDAVILDEFQNFSTVNPGVFSRFQMRWDESKGGGGGMLVACGSMQSMMYRIFQGGKEPLYKRATARLIVDEFSPGAVHGLLSKLCGSIDGRYFFDLYSVFGGIPFYYALIESGGLAGKPLREILASLVFAKNGILYDEGRDLTIEALGKSHAIYFSILEAVASGKTKYNEILAQSSISPGTIENYLSQLTDDYGFLTRRIPVFTKKENTRTSRYAISDNFLSFWFRFVHRHRSFLEIGGSGFFDIIASDFTNWQGVAWERITADILIEMNREQRFAFPFTRIGGHFMQKPGQEIDIVLVNDTDRSVAVGECKLNINGSNIPALVEGLRGKAATLPLPAKKLFLFSVAPLNGKTTGYLNRYEDVTAFTLDALLAAGAARSAKEAVASRPNKEKNP